MPTINAAIVGASGYAGMELARLLILHPNVRAEWFISRAAAGREVCDLIPALDGISDCRFTAPDDADFSNCDVVFFAAPSGVAMRAVPKLLEQGKVVIDIGADFRLRDINIFGEWYGEHTAPQLLQKAVYGLSEYARPQLKKANLIACPGCFATAAALALLPFANYIDGAIIVDAKSGVSGAGKRTDREDLLYAEQHGNFKAYAIGGHRHLPEMVQTLADGGLPKADITFVPHLLPAARGIYLSAYIPLKKNIPPPVQIAADYWRDEPFVSVRDYAPTLAQVVGSNRTRIGAMTAGNNKTAIVIAALDNLIKGAAGQAVQNMNIRFALPETAGLC